VHVAAGADDRDVEEIRALTPDAPALSISGASYVLVNLARLGLGKGLAVHLLNYAPDAISGCGSG
jgi:hypothetical protein